MSRMVSLTVLIAIVLVVGALFYMVMASFLLPLFLAVVLVVIFRPLHQWIVVKCKGHNRIAAALTTTAIMLIVLVPLLWVLILATADAVSFVSNMDRNTIIERAAKLRERFDLQLPDEMRATEQHLDELVVQRHAADWNQSTRQLADHIDELIDNVRGNEQADQDGAAEIGSSFVVEQLRSIKSQLSEMLEGDAPAGDGSEAVLENYQRIRPALIAHFTPGRFHAWLTAQANPTNRRLDEVRTALLARLGPQSLGPVALNTGQYVGGVLGKSAIVLFVMILALYYFLADGPGMVKAVMRLSPLEDHYETQMLAEFDKISRAVVAATLLSALVQGLLACVGYVFTGLGSVFLLTVLTMLLAMVPFVGAAAVWLPCSLWLFFVEDRATAAILLALYGTLVVSMADNIVKPWVLHGQSNLHPLLALLSVIGGVQALGPIGIFVGPMVVSFLQALLNMFHTELKALGEKAAGQASPQGENSS